MFLDAFNLPTGKYLYCSRHFVFWSSPHRNTLRCVPNNQLEMYMNTVSPPLVASKVLLLSYLPDEQDVQILVYNNAN